MTISRGEVGKRHFISATDLSVNMMDLAGKTIWRKPFSHRVCIKKRAVDSLRACPQHAMKPNCVGSHNSFSFPCDVTWCDVKRSKSGFTV
jgi:hypothetical protein